jgi:uncharacterized repeat protein (TIGR01451 family)
MTHKIRNLTAFGTFVLAGISAPAFAAGTTAGSTITNTVTVGYSVGGVAQTAVNASNVFTVDRKISLTVAETGTTTTTVVPGQVAAVTTFTVTNTSNATLDLGLSVAQQVGGATQHGGVDNFDVTTPTLYVDTNTNGVYDAGTDLAVSYLDELAADSARTVFVVANIPATRVNGDDAGVILTAQARESGVAGTQGAVSTETTGANTAGQDTVFADTAGATDALRDGQFSARDDYTVSAAALTVTKTSKVISDPSNGTTNPKLIPGAVVEYCIQVANGAGSAPATNVAITDTLPTQTTYLASFGVFVSGTVTGVACNADGTVTAAQTGPTITGTIPSIAINTTRTVYFRATVD